MSANRLVKPRSVMKTSAARRAFLSTCAGLEAVAISVLLNVCKQAGEAKERDEDKRSTTSVPFNLCWS